MTALGLCAQLACAWEATARKPGNVHRYADFDDACYLDFLASAAAVGPILDSAPTRRVGATILEAVAATRKVTATNTNLGIILLLAPLAKASPEEDLRTGVAAVLDQLDVEDAKLVYEAIRLVKPGGLGRVEQQDVHEEPTQTLREVMALAAERDRVARQYATGFAEIFDLGLPALLAGIEPSGALECGILHCHLQLLAAGPDSLIARKCGPETAEEASRRARAVLADGWPADSEAVAEFDAWLRADGNRRNPGTCADLTTACLFSALRAGMVTVPLASPFAGV